MSDATERLVNLAMYLSSARGPVRAEDIRAAVEGYPSVAEQDEDAFKRMLERDKEDLRDAGFVIESDAEGNYRLDPRATFAAEVTLTAEEAATVRAVGLALLADPSFPFANDLRFALAKIATALDHPDTPVSARTADERPEAQAAAVADLDRAIESRKNVHFEYTNSFDEDKRHEVEPYGLFVRDGRWYLVGRDISLAEERVYAVTRMRAITVNPARPKSPDFERPAGFDVATFIALPFQYGHDEFEATLAFSPREAWRVPLLTAGRGATEQDAEGRVFWRVIARDRARLLRWIVENGPGISVEAPADLAAALLGGLERAAALHEGGGDA